MAPTLTVHEGDTHREVSVDQLQSAYRDAANALDRGSAALLASDPLKPACEILGGALRARLTRRRG
jgi:hypothetical protein